MAERSPSPVDDCLLAPDETLPPSQPSLFPLISLALVSCPQPSPPCPPIPRRSPHSPLSSNPSCCCAALSAPSSFHCCKALSPSFLDLLPLLPWLSPLSDQHPLPASLSLPLRPPLWLLADTASLPHALCCQLHTHSHDGCVHPSPPLQAPRTLLVSGQPGVFIFLPSLSWCLPHFLLMPPSGLGPGVLIVPGTRCLGLGVPERRWGVLV